MLRDMVSSALDTVLDILDLVGELGGIREKIEALNAWVAELPEPEYNELRVIVRELGEYIDIIDDIEILLEDLVGKLEDALRGD